MTKTTSTTPELDWDHLVRDIPESRPLSRQRQAAPDELAGIARTLDLVACRSLTVDYTIAQAGGGRYRLEGRLRAEVEQTCVVTLEPVASVIDEGFDVTFWPQDDMPVPHGGEVDVDEEPEPEPIVDGHIAAGRVVFECLASAIDPFPRSPGATLERQSTGPSEGVDPRSASPFAVLANVKTKG